MILIALSLVQINASKYRSIRQTKIDQCDGLRCERNFKEIFFNIFLVFSFDV